MKKSVISKFLLGSFLVPSLLASTAHVKAGGDDYCLGPRGKLPSCFLTNVLLYLPNSDDRMRVSQTCKNGQTANLQVRMLDLAKYGQTNYPKKWKPKEQKAKEAEALKNELIKSVNVNPKIEAIRLSYRQFSLLKNHQFSEEDTISLKNVFANKIVILDEFFTPCFGSSSFERSSLKLKKFKCKFGVKQLEVERLGFNLPDNFVSIFDPDPPCYKPKTLNLQDIEEIPSLFGKVRTILYPKIFEFNEEKTIKFPAWLNASSILVEVKDKNGDIILEKLQNKDEKLVTYNISRYKNIYKKERTIDKLRNANVCIKDLDLYSIEDFNNFLTDLHFLKDLNITELQNLMFPQRIALWFNCDNILKPICDLLEFFSDPNLKFNSPVIEIEDIDYNHKLFTEEMMFAPIKKVSISKLFIRDQDSVKQFIKDLKKAKELNMLDRFNFKIAFDLPLPITPDQQEKIFEYLPRKQTNL